MLLHRFLKNVAVFVHQGDELKEAEVLEKKGQAAKKGGEMSRIIGIRHRRKKTTAEESRPTMVALRNENGDIREFALPDDDSELDFLLGVFPTSYRNLGDGEGVEGFLPRHVKQEKKSGRTRVPASYEGFTSGDTVAMLLGGSGDRFAYALSRRGEEIGAEVFRIPAFHLKGFRGDSDTEKNHLELVNCYLAKPSLFYRVGPRDRSYIEVFEAYRARRHTMRDRIACQQRIYQQVVGKVFLSSEGRYPEGKIEDEYDKAKANHRLLNLLLAEEEERTRELKKAVQCLPVWKEIFEDVVGLGEVIAAGLISAVQDIRRFNSKREFKAFLGVHILPDGSFVRKRRGSVANWNPGGRQALYLLAEQWNRRPDSEWGKKLREVKRTLREKHPESVLVNGKQRYTDGHIHKMALWRTMTKFAEHLFKEWRALELK